MTSPPDATLLERWFARRDAEAFREILARHTDMVYATCRRIVRDSALAEDLAQECFLRLAGRKFEKPRSLAAWLHTVATRAALDRVRTESRRRIRERTYVKMAADREPASWAEIESSIDEEIAALPEDLRVVIVRHFLEGQSQQSIADSIGLTRSAVHRRVGRGLDRLRDGLRKRGVVISALALGAALTGEARAAASPALHATLGKLAVSGVTVVETPAVLVGGWIAMKKLWFGVLVLALLGGIWMGAERWTPGGDEIVSERTEIEDTSAVEGASSGGQSRTATPNNAADTITGRVVDELSRPVPDAVVALSLGDTRRMLRSGPTGEFAWPENLTIDSTVTAYHRDFGIGLAAEIRADSESGRSTVTIRLRPLARLRCRVVEGESQTPVADLEFRLEGRAFDHDGIAERLALVGLDVLVRRPIRSDEEYVFIDLPAGVYEFAFPLGGMAYVAPGYFRTTRLDPVRVADGEAEKIVEIDLERGGTITGRVSDPDGNGVPGATVRVVASASSYVYDREADTLSSSYETWEESTDAAGEFRYRGLRFGETYIAIASAPGYAPGASEARSLRRGVATPRVDVRLAPGRQVAGKFVDDRGRAIGGLPLQFARRFARTTSRFGMPEAQTSEDGTFRVSGFAPGTFVVYPRTNRYHTSTQQSFVVPVSGDAIGLEFVLRRLQEGSLSGRVVDASGAPIAGAEVRAFSRDGSGVHERARTNADGTYRLQNLGQGAKFDLIADRPGFARGDLRGVELDATGVDFVLERFGGVRGRVVATASGDPVASFELRAVSYRVVPAGETGVWKPVHSESGEFSFGEVPPGACVIEVRAPGFAPARTDRLHVESKGWIEGVNVWLEKVVPIEGRVTDAATGEPLADVAVRLFRGGFGAHLLSERALVEGPSWFVRTDAGGRFLFDSFTPGESYGVAAWRSEFGTRVVGDVTSGARLELALRHEARLRVRVADHGAVSTRRSISVLQLDGFGSSGVPFRASRSAQPGAMEFEGLPAGRFRIVLELDRSAAGIVFADVSEGATVDAELDLNSLATKHGRVSGTIDAGAFTPGRRVILETAGEAFHRVTATVNEDRTFRFGGIPPGSYRLRYRLPGVREDLLRDLVVRSGEEEAVVLSVPKE